MAAFTFSQLHLCLRLIILIYLSFYIIHVQTKYMAGVLESDEDWAFLARFCFHSKVSSFIYTFQYPEEYATQHLLLYYDEPGQWDSVYGTGKTCKEKEKILNASRHQIVVLNEYYKRANHTYCKKERLPNNKYIYICYGNWSFNTVRERWWYMAISSCGSNKGLYLKYEMMLLNAKRSEFWFSHFSADEFYILHVDLVFLVFNAFLLLASLCLAHNLRTRGLFHTTFKLYLASVFAQLVGVMCLFITYYVFADNGQGIPPLKTLGQLCLAVSSTLFILLILLLGKGYTVTRARLRKKSTIRLTIFITLYSVTYAILFIYEMEVFDPGEVLYLYESPGGYGIMGLRVIGWLMLLYAVGFTLKHHPHKFPFYVPFLIYYSLWFLTAPILIVIFTYVIDKWVRETVVNGVELSVTLLGHLFFLLQMCPTSANKNFPFHIKTTQIRALEQFGTIDGTNHLDNFSRHPYEAPPIKRNKRVKEILLTHPIDSQLNITPVGNGNSINSFTVPIPALQSQPATENSVPIGS